MNLAFSPVSLEYRDKYYSLWLKTPQNSLDYTLANIWGWQAYFGLEWAFDGELCWVRQNRPVAAMWAPFGDWKAVEWQDIFAGAGPECRRFIRVPEKLLGIWKEKLPGRVTAEEDRGQWEYLYNQQELATLPGKRFHKKKNHYNAYVKTYGEPDYHELNDDIVEDVLALQDNWCQWHECGDSPSLTAENEAINRVLSHWESFRDLYGGALYIDGRIAAFSIGEKLDDEMLGVHYEKGLNGYNGIYQAINREFSACAGKGFSLVNRAQDLDENGLRQAKTSYQPVGFLKKYKVSIND